MSENQNPMILSVDEIAKRANAVVSDVDTLIAQLRMMIEEQTNGS